MNYKKLYDQIINIAVNRITDGYTERHHIIPRCLGGSDAKSNIVKLTAREHFIFHYLLCNIYQNTHSYYKLLCAFNSMQRGSDKHDRYFNSRLFESQRKHFASEMSANKIGSNNSQYGTMWITDGIDNAKISKTDTVPLGWRIGRDILGLKRPVKQPLSQEEKLKRELIKRQKLSIASTLNNPHRGKIWITNGKDSARIIKSDIIPDGWRKGRVMPVHNKNHTIT